MQRVAHNQLHRCEGRRSDWFTYQIRCNLQNSTASMKVALFLAVLVYIQNPAGGSEEELHFRVPINDIALIIIPKSVISWMSQGHNLININLTMNGIPRGVQLTWTNLVAFCEDDNLPSRNGEVNYPSSPYFRSVLLFVPVSGFNCSISYYHSDDYNYLYVYIHYLHTWHSRIAYYSLDFVAPLRLAFMVKNKGPKKQRLIQRNWILFFRNSKTCAMQFIAGFNRIEILMLCCGEGMH